TSVDQAVAGSNAHLVHILVWHYHDDDVAGPNADISLDLTGLPRSAKQASVTHYRVDANHSNSYAEWQRLGSPPAPSQPIYAQLEKAGQLTALSATPETVRIERSSVHLTFSLPRQGVSLLELRY